MKIQYASDLHLEFLDNSEYLRKNRLEPVGDILILAGDIINLTEKQLKHPAFDRLTRDWEQVYMIPGNHEFYKKFDISQVFPSWELKIKENITYLNNKVINYPEVRIIFTTLFSFIPEEKAKVIRFYLNDFRVSNYDGEKLSIANYNHCHKQSVDFLENELKKEFEGKTLVVSHHLPFNKSYCDYPKYPVDLNEAFHTDLEYLFEKYKIDHWIYGHNHLNQESFKIRNTEFHTNQLGYVQFNENSGFKRDAFIEI